MTIDGTTVTYKAITDSCSQSAGLSCNFSPTGLYYSYPQIRFFFNRNLASTPSFTTSPSTVFLGDSVNYYENECQYDAGGAYRGYDTSTGSIQVSVTGQSSDLYGTDLRFNFSGAVHKATPAYARTITSGSVNLHLCTHDDCTDKRPRPASAIVRADTINRNQLYTGVTIGQKESKCYYFTPPSAQTYALQISSAVTINSMNVNYGYRTTSGFGGGSCGTAGNGTCNIAVSGVLGQTAIEITAGNNLAGSFSMQITP